MSKLCGPQRRVDVGLERVVKEVGIKLKAVSATMSTTMRVALRTGRPAPRGEPHGASVAQRSGNAFVPTLPEDRAVLPGSKTPAQGGR